MIRKYLLLNILALSCICLYAQSDSIVSRSSIFVIPHASYQQETSWAPGIAYGYYFKSRDLSRISSISGSAVYTFKNQFILNVSPKIYFKGDNWYLYSNFNLKNYPDHYYGIGNEGSGVKQAFTSSNMSLVIQPQYAFTRNFYAGPYVLMRFESLKTDSAFITHKDWIYSYYGDAGWKSYHQIAIGAVAMYDSRDNSFYPYRGTFAKGSFAFSFAGLGSTYSLQQFSVDLRQYLPLFNKHVFAMQLRFDGIFGSKGIPFQMLPTVGGRDLMRGFREGKYKDNLLLSFQTEYRLPIYKRIKAAVFCATGDVFDSTDFRTGKLKFTYGAGLRCRINDARVHLRFDVAKNNYGDKLQFYITASEAF